METSLQRMTSVSIIKFKKSFCFYGFMIVIQVNESFKLTKTKNIIFFISTVYFKHVKKRENKL